jgi:hypothetical protein
MSPRAQRSNFHGTGLDIRRPTKQNRRRTNGPQSFVQITTRCGPPNTPAAGPSLMSRPAYPVTRGAAGRDASDPPRSCRRSRTLSVVTSQPWGPRRNAAAQSGRNRSWHVTTPVPGGHGRVVTAALGAGGIGRRAMRREQRRGLGQSAAPNTLCAVGDRGGNDRRHAGDRKSCRASGARDAACRRRIPEDVRRGRACRVRVGAARSIVRPCRPGSIRLIVFTRSMDRSKEATASSPDLLTLSLR